MSIPEETTQEELLSLISRLNKDDHVNGYSCTASSACTYGRERDYQAISPAKVD